MTKSSNKNKYSKQYKEKDKLLSGLKVFPSSEVTLKNEKTGLFDLKKEYEYLGKVDRDTGFVVINANARFRNNKGAFNKVRYVDDYSNLPKKVKNELVQKFDEEGINKKGRRYKKFNTLYLVSGEKKRK